MRISCFFVAAASLVCLTLSCGTNKQSEEYIRDRILKIYTSDYSDREREFTSSDFYVLWKKVTEGTADFVDYDHWIDGQDAKFQ